jgi:ABC-2 type transport system permease protein
VLANVVVVLAAFTLSLFLVVQQLLQVPIAGSVPLLLAGTAIYLAAAATNDVFLCPVFICPVARSMAQFAFLVIMAVIPIIMLSRGMGAVESKSDIVQRVTTALASPHFRAFAKAVAFRGAGLDAVWFELSLMAGLDIVFFATSMVPVRRIISVLG